jgi:hypothetical protein
MSDTFKYLRYRLRHSLPHGNGQRLFLTALLVLALPVGIVLVRQIQRYQAGAALDTASLYFSPAQQNLPPDSNFKIMIDTKTNLVGFVRVEFTIDPAKVNLVSEITVTPRLATVVQKSTMAEVNSTGQGIIVAALSTTDRGNPLSGIVELANFNLHTVTTAANNATTLSITDSGIQLIDMQSTVVPFTSASSSLILNASVPTSTGTTAPTSTTAITATGTATKTPTPTLTPTGTAAPTSTGTLTPTATKTPTPTVAAATNTPTTATNTAAPTAAPKTGDVNGDNVINITDIGIIVDSYGTQPPTDPRADLNKDGKVNIVDIGIVIDNYGR